MGGVLLQLASLLCTGIFLWKTASTAHWLQLSIRWLMLQSALAALAAWLASAGITITLYALVIQGERKDRIRAALRTSSVAVWFAPAVILLSQLSPVALAGALLLVIYTARLLYSQWRELSPARESPAPVPRDAPIFSRVEQPAPWQNRAPAMVASLCVQTGVIGTIFHYPLLAGIGYAMSTAVLTVFALASGAYKAERSATLPRSVMGVLATILLAAGLTVGGLVPRMMHSRGWGEIVAQHDLIETARAFLRELLYGERPSPPGAPDGLPGAPNPLKASRRTGGGPDNYGVPDDPRTGFGDDGFPGVILWPEVKPIPTLIAPMPEMPSGLFTAADMQPLSIPFSGEYWMFRWPYASAEKFVLPARQSGRRWPSARRTIAQWQMEAHPTSSRRAWTFAVAARFSLRSAMPTGIRARCRWNCSC